jgi:hypothetical protein
MIFPSDSLYQLRRTLMARADAGEITKLESFQEALRADPDDATSLTYVGLKAEEAGDLSEAERYVREAIRNHPSGHEGYTILARILNKADPNSALARGYLELGLAKVQFDEEALDSVNQEAIAASWGVDENVKTLPPDQFLTVLSAVLKRDRSESLEVEEELRPHRLIHELRECGDAVLDRTLVDSILEHARECEPLLLGILKEFGADQLTDDDYRMVERAIVLLGEIGSPSVLPAITEFLALDEEELSGPADWAFRRISIQHPLETLEEIGKMLPSAETPERVVLAQQIAMMPKVPGRSAMLSNIVQGVERLPKGERNAVIFSAIAGFYLVEGGKSFQAAALERKYVGSFSGEDRADLRALHRETAHLEPADATPDELSVYDICCTDPDLTHDDDEDEDEPMVRQEVKPGRNEPCWCGSGKKYKKCHLDEDQRG